MSNYRIQQRTYAVLYKELAGNFKRYLESIDFDEIQALTLDLAANGGGIQPIENYSHSVELLQAFDLFYYINDTLPYTAGLLPIPEGDFPVFVDGQKISIKKVCEELFQGTLTHGILPRPFLWALNLFFAGNMSYSKNALSELYYKLSL